MLHYILRGIFLSCSFTLITLTASAQLRKTDTTAYNKLVFPADVNKYPLLFVTDGFDANNNIRRKFKRQAKNDILRFIKTDTRFRGFQHQLISASEIDSYPDSIYRYLVKTTSMSQTVTTSTSNGHVNSSERMLVSFRFTDRQNPSYLYSKYGRCKVLPKAEYSLEDIEGCGSEHFFKDLNRIISMLDSGKSP